MWYLVLQLDGQEPEQMGVYRSWREAERAAYELAALHSYTGGKVSIVQPESSDQLQRMSAGRWHLEQPTLPAAGESVVVQAGPIRIPREMVKR